MVPSSRAGDVKQMPLAGVDLFEIGFVADGLDALLKRNHFVVARHHRDRAKLQPFARCIVQIEA